MEFDQSKIENARKGLNEPIGYCGHHCTYCFLADKCGGCRSSYNCCSFATLFDSRTCPNVDCAVQNGLDGCYECDELDSCQKGYYSRTEEYVCKATSLFIRQYGKSNYTIALERAIQSGLDYPKSFDATGSVEKAYQLLEQYLK